MNNNTSAATRLSIQITEDDENFDLDKLLIGDSITTGVSSNNFPPQSTSVSNVDAPTLTPTLAVEEEGRGGVVGEVSTKDDPAQASSSSSVLRVDAGTTNIGNSIHRVPSKSILKKTSSYLAVNDLNTSMSKSMRSVNGGGGILRKASYLSITTMTSNNDNAAIDLSMSTKSSVRNNRTRVGSVSSYNSQSQDVGLDVDGDGDSNTTPRFNFSSAPNSPLSEAEEEGFIQFNNFLKTPSCNDFSSTNTASATVAVSTVNDTSIRSTCSSSSNKNMLRRNSVSFHSVDVREYDRTVGDNPSCRSGPPVSTHCSIKECW